MKKLQKKKLKDSAKENNARSPLACGDSFTRKIIASGTVHAHLHCRQSLSYAAGPTFSQRTPPYSRRGGGGLRKRRGVRRKRGGGEAADDTLPCIPLLSYGNNSVPQGASGLATGLVECAARSHPLDGSPSSTGAQFGTRTTPGVSSLAYPPTALHPRRECPQYRPLFDKHRPGGPQMFSVQQLRRLPRSEVQTPCVCRKFTCSAPRRSPEPIVITYLGDEREKVRDTSTIINAVRFRC